MSDPSIDDWPFIRWNEGGEERTARWRSESGTSPPRDVVTADDRMSADKAYHLACQGTALLWHGDFQNARQLLQAMTRRANEKPRERKGKTMTADRAEAFHSYRLAQSQRARTLGMLLIPFDAGHIIPLRRAPDVRRACTDAYGGDSEPYIASLRGLQGVIGAFEWRKNGIYIPALNARIHPHYGVFAPIRSEYVGLVNEAPLPRLTATRSVAFDIGTGTGVLAAVLARRGIKRIIATDQDPRALACARENLTELGFGAQIEVMQADLFPEGRAALIVCNPPWLPARPSSRLERAVFDLDSRMLRGFIDGLTAHLEIGGEGWLLLSDLAEHLCLRTRAELLATIDEAGLKVSGKIDVNPHHPRIFDTKDPLHAARAAEVTSLWRLAAKHP